MSGRPDLRIPRAWISAKLQNSSHCGTYITWTDWLRLDNADTAKIMKKGIPPRMEASIIPAIGVLIFHMYMVIPHVRKKRAACTSINSVKDRILRIRESRLNLLLTIPPLASWCPRLVKADSNTRIICLARSENNTQDNSQRRLRYRKSWATKTRCGTPFHCNS